MQKRGLHVSMGTSGILIDDELGPMKYAELQVAISLDSTDPEMHDRFRGLRGHGTRR
jgi:MoaA/NifB/PqqE/SkfB family radical SAM enzyme